MLKHKLFMLGSQLAQYFWFTCKKGHKNVLHLPGAATRLRANLLWSPISTKMPAASCLWSPDDISALRHYRSDHHLRLKRNAIFFYRRKYNKSSKTDFSLDWWRFSNNTLDSVPTQVCILWKLVRNRRKYDEIPHSFLKFENPMTFCSFCFYLISCFSFSK